MRNWNIKLLQRFIKRNIMDSVDITRVIKAGVNWKWKKIKLLKWDYRKYVSAWILPY